MRRIVIAAFVSLDGVMQAPGGPDEDTTGGFAHGGWVRPYWDEASRDAMNELFSAPFDLLLGRRTYDIFAGYWPSVRTDPVGDPLTHKIATSFNRTTKYVATRSPDTLGWENSRWLGPDPAAALRKLKAEDGPTLLVQGSSELIQLLLAEGLADELRLKIFPVVLGPGKRLFGNGARPEALRLVECAALPSGVLTTTYAPAGEVRTGSFAAETRTD